MGSCKQQQGGEHVNQRRLWSLISLLTILAMTNSACGADATATLVPAPTATTAAPPTTAAAPPTDTAAAAPPTATTAAAPATATTASGTSGGSVYVGFVPPALTSPFHVAMADGATA